MIKVKCYSASRKTEKDKKQGVECFCKDHFDSEVKVLMNN